MPTLTGGSTASGSSSSGMPGSITSCPCTRDGRRRADRPREMVMAEHFFAQHPSEVALDAAKVQALFDRAQREVNEGLLPSCQIASARRGKIGAMCTFGQAVQGGKEKPATDQTLYIVFSCTKAIMASAAWLLIGEGKLDPSRRAVEYVPEFGTNGKDVVTVE